MRLLLLFCGIAFTFVLVAATAAPGFFTAEVNATSWPASLLGGRAEKTSLRIMALGASISNGYASADGNGYRKVFRQALRQDGWEVEMVGNVQTGDMADSDNEGWPGLRINQVTEKAKLSIPVWKPNVVLINLGTNDAIQGWEVASAGSRMRELLEYIKGEIPDVTIVMSTLLPLPSNPTNAQNINSQYRSLITDLKQNQWKIILAEMDDGWISSSLLIDGVHPTAEGYTRMASRFYQAVNIAAEADYLSPPSELAGAVFVETPADDEDTTCYKTAGSAKSDPRTPLQILWGSSPRILGDGPYLHSSNNRGSLLQVALGPDDNKWFAQLVTQGAPRSGATDELVYTHDGALWMRVNSNGAFAPAVKINPQQDCSPDAATWADMNNDGLDDFICISQWGEIHVSLNQGGNPPQFNYVGMYHGSVPGYARINVRVADIDGDGRADYCLLKEGLLRCWRNGGVGNLAEYWQDLGGVIHSLQVDNAAVRLADMNGDFRADFLQVTDTGAITTETNHRQAGKGIAPGWLSSGVTHGGVNEKGAREHIRLGRIYGSGRLDYAHFKCSEDDKDPDEEECLYDMRVWENIGWGGTSQKGDGAFFCDMSGSGNDDYIWSNKAGDITIFRNPNKPPSTASFAWDEHTTVLKTGVGRQHLQFGDWNGDGKCDVIATDWTTGAVDVWLTTYVNNKFTFSAKTRVAGSGASGGMYCPDNHGVHLFDIGVRYADLDGDGRVDYLCMEPNGRTVGWLNKAGGASYIGQVKFSEGRDRMNLRWADVNGDGKADLLWVEKFSGDAVVWYNGGNIPTGGSNWKWDGRSLGYLGSANGFTMQYANIGGIGRADMVEVRPQSGTGYASFNTCGGSSGSGSSSGDDVLGASLQLPSPPDAGDLDLQGKGVIDTGGNNNEYCGDSAEPPLSEDFRIEKITCESKYVTDSTGMAQSERWNGVLADDVLQWAVDKWSAGYVDSADDTRECSFTTFSSWFSNVFHGTEDYLCGDLYAETCDDNLQCDEVHYAVGAYFVLNSMVTLRGVYKAALTVLGDIETSFSKDVNAIMTTFCPAKEPDLSLEILKVLFDLTLFAATGASAVFWNKVITTTTRFTGDDRGVLKDGYNAAVNFVFSAIKDTQLVAVSQAKAEKTVDTQKTKYFDLIRNMLLEYNKFIFNGTDESLGTMQTFLQNGKFMPNSGVSLNVDEFTAGMKEMLYVMLIPTAWRLLEEPVYPFVLETEDPCGNHDTFHDLVGQATSIDPEQVGLCDEDHMSYLLSAKAREDGCTDVNQCNTWTLDAFALPGGDKDTLNGVKWGSITFEKLMLSVRDSFRAYGYKNGWSAKLTDDESKSVDDPLLLDDPLAMVEDPAAGLYMWNIPYCDKAKLLDVVENIADNTEKTAWWPCAEEGVAP